MTKATKPRSKNRSADLQTGKPKATKQKAAPQKPRKPNDSCAQNQDVIFIELAKIEKDDEVFYCRKRDNQKYIKKYTDIFKDYKEARERGEDAEYPFVPICVQKRGKRYVLVAGYHRLAAACNAGIDKILALVFEGTEKEAVWFALTNNQHGAQLEGDDLEHSIEKALKLFPEKSPPEIAGGIGCSRSYVYKIEKKLSTSGQLKIPEKRLGLDGKMRSTQRKTAVKQKREGIAEETQKQEPPKGISPKVKEEKGQSDPNVAITVPPLTPEIPLEPSTVSSPALSPPSGSVVSDEPVIMRAGQPVFLKPTTQVLFEQFVIDKDKRLSELCASLFTRSFEWLKLDLREKFVENFLSFLWEQGHGDRITAFVKSRELGGDRECGMAPPPKVNDKNVPPPSTQNDSSGDVETDRRSEEPHRPLRPSP